MCTRDGRVSTDNGFIQYRKLGELRGVFEKIFGSCLPLDKVLRHLDEKYKKHHPTSNGHTLETIKNLYTLLSSADSKRQLERRVHAHHDITNLALFLYKGPMLHIPQFRCKVLKYITASGSVCETCFKHSTDTNVTVSREVCTVTSEDAYWFILSHICSSCYINKLYTVLFAVNTGTDVRIHKNK